MRYVFTLAAVLALGAMSSAADCPGGKCPVKRAGGAVVRVATAPANAVQAVRSSCGTAKSERRWYPGKLLGRRCR